MQSHVIEGRVVAITGSARGIGFATAKLLTTRGAKVAIADIDGDAAESAAGELGENAAAYQMDVADREAFGHFLGDVSTRQGEVTTLINNAGILDAAPRITEQDPAMTDKTIAVNLGGVMNGTRLGIEAMLRRGSGQIVNVASLGGKVAVPGLAAYSAAKFGVIGFTSAVRLEYHGSGLIFTCVMPGPVATGMMDGTRESSFVKLIEPEKVAIAIVEAIETGRQDVVVPRSTGIVSSVVAALPPEFQYRATKFLGMDAVYTDIDPVARSEYQGRISRSA